MRVRWTTDAADDLERICDYIADSRPEAARRVAQSVVERIGTFRSHHHRSLSSTTLDRASIPGARSLAIRE